MVRVMDAIGEFRETLATRLARTRNVDGVPGNAIDMLSDLLGEHGQSGITDANPNPLAATFDDALNTAINAAESEIDVRLLNRLGEISGRLDWFRRPSDPGSSFYEGHANAEVIGRRGIQHIDGLTVGLTVMRPETVYPDHHHPPEEVYLILSQGDWRQENGPWHEPGYGGYVYNPPNIVHAMRARDQPLLAIWCLNHSDA